MQKCKSFICVSVLGDIFYVCRSKYVYILSAWNRVWHRMRRIIGKGNKTSPKESNLTIKASSLQPIS